MSNTVAPTSAPTLGAGVSSVSVTSEIVIPDFSNYDPTAMLNAVGTASNMGASKVTIESVEFIVTTSYTFPNGGDVNVDTLRASIASANSVTEFQVTVSAQRRLSASERQLAAATFDVEISSSDPAMATAVKTSAQDTSALNTALASNGITTTAPSATTPQGKVKVVTAVSVPASGSVTDVATALDSGLATQINSNIVGATATVMTPVIVTNAPTAALTPAPAVPSGGSADSGSPPNAVTGTPTFLAVLLVCALPWLGAS
jgi:hypothetical protein